MATKRKTHMKRSSLFLIALALTAIALAACSTSTGGDTAVLENVTWVLEAYGKGGSTPVLEDVRATAEFNGEEGAISGSASCNTYAGGFEVKGSDLSVGPLAFTEMYCTGPEGIMEQETQFMAALATAEGYQIQDGKLRISCADDQVLVFGKEADG